jgi:ribosomal protein RSM22 (predicted rRNA methylase)
MNKHWTKLDLKALRQLREGFLDRTAGQQDYWNTPERLALYDATFAARIGWKWDAVLRELTARDWKPQSRFVVDWACGSGIAGRSVLEHWPHLEALAVHDRSPLAMRYAADKARATFPRVRIESLPSPLPPNTLLLLSHVISELPDSALAPLLEVARQAHEIIWVEAGTHADSRRLIAVREALRGEFAAVAPCTHQATCGLLAPQNTTHWCHHFAPVPPEIFQDARWMEFGRELGIDLRSLPYSFLVLEHPRTTPPTPEGLSRIIGEPREATGYLKVLSCQATGVADLMLQKRNAPALFKALRKGRAPLVQQWTMADGKITGSATFAAAEEEPSS